MYKELNCIDWEPIVCQVHVYTTCRYPIKPHSARLNCSNTWNFQYAHWLSFQYLDFWIPQSLLSFHFIIPTLIISFPLIRYFYFRLHFFHVLFLSYFFSILKITLNPSGTYNLPFYLIHSSCQPFLFSMNTMVKHRKLGLQTYLFSCTTFISLYYYII